MVLPGYCQRVLSKLQARISCNAIYYVVGTLGWFVISWHPWAFFEMARECTFWFTAARGVDRVSE